MRTLLVSLLALLGMAASCPLPVAAQPKLPPQKPSLPPGTTLQLPPRISQVKHVAAPGGTLAYGGGPLSLEVQIESGRTASVAATIVLTPMSGTSREPIRTSVTIPSGTSRHVVTLSDGLLSLCTNASFWVGLESAAPVETALRQVIIRPGCSFRAEGVDSFRGLAPDRILGQTEGRLHYYNPVLVTRRPNCSNPLRVTAEVQNNTAIKINDARLEVRRAPRSFGRAGPLTLAPREHRPATIDASFDGYSTTLDVSSNQAGQVLRSHFSIQVTPACLLSVTLR